jgi:tetratricopeptide (TPR) repeat protein
LTATTGQRIDGDRRWSEIVESSLAADQHRAGVALNPGDEATGANPASPDAFFAAAGMLCARGQPAAAIVCLRKALAIAPGDARLHNAIGLVLQQLGQIEASLPHHRQALALDPDMAEAHAGLGNACRLVGRLKDAADHYQNALSVRPGYAAAHNDIAGILHLLGRSNEAIDHYRHALSARPDNADAHYNLANVLAGLGRPAEALPHYTKALEIRPRFAEAHNNFGNLLQKLARHDEAVVQYAAAVAAKPDYAAAYHNLGKACFALDRYDQAVAAYEKALAIDPSRPAVYHDLGAAHMVLGHFREAYAAFADAVARDPWNAAVHLNLAGLAPFTAGEPRLLALEKLAEFAPSLGENNKIALHFALGKAYADLGDSDRSFRHLLDGNALKRRQIAYDEAATLGRFASIRAAFTPEVIQDLGGYGDNSQLPVFIVGMPRSGTTLLEQILASHSGVSGLGEIDDFAKAVKELPGASKDFAEFLSGLGIGDLRRLGRNYVNSVGAKAPGAMRIADKMLTNFAYVGLIHLALPNARIIHACRDPVDTCLSCFSLLFTDDLPFTYDLAEVGRYYRAYAELMRHWHAVLPEGVMIDVHYEDVVADLEGQARRLVAHCGLGWEDRCLDFHRTQRPVHTASVAQVRRPIYRDSVGRSRTYGDLLNPVLDALEGDDIGARQPSFAGWQSS